MNPSDDTSDVNGKSIIVKSLVVWFVPTCFLLPQMAKNGLSALQVVLFFPTMNSFPLAWLMAGSSQANGLIWPIGIFLSIALPGALVILALQTSRRRPVVFGVGLLGSCALAAGAYGLLRA